jgi:hypothetical protein
MASDGGAPVSVKVAVRVRPLVTDEIGAGCAASVLVDDAIGKVSLGNSAERTFV